MDAASSKIVLERLKEEWLQVTDASMYREMELEKQLWMLTTLQHLKRKCSNDDVLAKLAAAPGAEGPTKAKHLSLYENHGTFW